MYKNIGKKIKTLAKAMFIIEAIASVISGIALMPIDDEFILYGLLIIFFGPVVAWVSSWILYGFGELVDKTCDIECILRTGAVGTKAEESDESLPEI
jgi:hypothetical protein